MWWRASALEALRAFIIGPLTAAGRAESRKLQEAVASLLAPTLDVISSTPPLQVPTHPDLHGFCTGAHCRGHDVAAAAVTVAAVQR
jgi:hypothetical protein